MSEKFTVVRTERGWAGHFCGAKHCKFRRNTLLRCKDKRIVVSTVGLYQPFDDKDYVHVGIDRYFETMAFEAEFDGRYWDADVSKEINFESQWSIAELDADDVANFMHENVVNELSAWLVDQQV